MKKLTKISIVIPLILFITAAYAFAAFVGHQIKPMPEPVNLLITGVGLFTAGHLVRHLTRK